MTYITYYLYYLYTYPAQHIISADIGATTLNYIYALYALYDLFDLYDRYDLYFYLYKQILHNISYRQIDTGSI